MNDLKIGFLLFLAAVAISLSITFATTFTNTEDHTPTPSQVKKVLTKICGNTVTSECLDAFLKSRSEG